MSKNDLSQSNPEKLAELSAKLKKWQKEMGASVLKPNPKFDPNAPLKPPAKPVRKKKRK